MAQKLPTLIVAVSHKHNRLPIPYRKGETVSCLSWGSFMVTVPHPKKDLLKKTAISILQQALL
ncbi:hypothetical protein C0J26_09390 [Pseudomonas baetica]|nr:hypothetical protein C0J26_09390 [Pseudomonas baetica]